MSRKIRNARPRDLDAAARQLAREIRAARRAAKAAAR